ncbi:MAG: VWA domain-containing protein [Deltaproteobacteria bacterium]|nr:VWA domain-containing protein [Deltaproteobacteria bacterium]
MAMVKKLFPLFLFMILASCSDGVGGLIFSSSSDGGITNNTNSNNNTLNNNNANDILNNSNNDGMVGCDPKNFSLKASPPAEVYLVIDSSGSMLEDGATPGLSRWEEVISAVDTALTQFEGSVKFGLLIYPVNDQCETAGPVVSFGLNNRDEILYHLINTVPQGGTPTAAAIKNAASSLDDFGDPASPKFIILATDGGPNCNYFVDASSGCSCTYASPEYCCTNYPASCIFGYSCLDDTNSLSVITSMSNDKGIDTFVIGLSGTSEYVNLLNEMAVAGGQAQQGAPTQYYSAENESELSTALQTIAVSVISCVIELDEPPQFPNYVHVYMDGGEVPRDGTKTDGWDFNSAEMTSIELYGQACDSLRDGVQHNLTATFACIVD